MGIFRPKIGFYRCAFKVGKGTFSLSSLVNTFSLFSLISTFNLFNLIYQQIVHAS